MKKTKFPQFFGGEPIWSQVVRHGKKMFCLFWPGCSFNITGHNPTKDIPYNRSLQYSQRVDMVIDWLQLPSIERPSMIMAYFDQPDYVGHFHTTDEQVNLELQYIESVLNYFFTSLHTTGLMDCVNVVILSKTTEEVIDKFSCPADKSYRVFDRSSTPKRFHYASTPRVGDVILDGQKGTTFYPTKLSDYGVTADHGYDYLDEEMHAIFFATGPNIQPALRFQIMAHMEF
uniref:Uncharacterized protein n=1 Tax=Panagrolaimus sp. ES5 TaxID=591445 RepID=A0AC34F160_9BILA